MALREFTDALAMRLGVDPAATYQLFSAWMPYEGGSPDNPLNTTQDMPGATRFNDVGVRRYKSLSDGVEATAKTLSNGLYPRIIQALKTGRIDASIAPDVRTWTSGKPNGHSNFADALEGRAAEAESWAGKRQSAPILPTGYSPTATPMTTSEWRKPHGSASPEDQPRKFGWNQASQTRDPQNHILYSDGTYRDDAGNVWVPGKSASDPGIWVNPQGQVVDSGSGALGNSQVQAAAQTTYGKPATTASQTSASVPTGTMASRLADMLDALMGEKPNPNDPKYSDPTNPSAGLYQKDLDEWSQTVTRVATAKKNIEMMQRGLYEIGGRVVPSESATDEERRIATELGVQQYNGLLNQFGLDKYKIETGAQDRQNKQVTDTYAGAREKAQQQASWDSNNQARSRAEIDRWIKGQETATGDANRIETARKHIQDWGTTGGKTDFSAQDFGAGAGMFTSAFGIDKSAPLIKFPGTQTWNPVQDRLTSLAGMGIDNAAPAVPALNQAYSDIPTQGPLNTAGIATPNLIPPVPPAGIPAAALPLPPGATGQVYDRALPGEPGFAGGTDMPPHMIPVPRFVGGTDPVGESLTGTKVEEQAATNAKLWMDPVLAARGQDASAQTAAMQANAQLQAAYISANQAAQQARAQFYIEQGQLGATVAQNNYQQRLGQVQQQLQYAQQLTTAQGARVSARMQALNLLASRSGPQDWVAYNHLLNQMGKPTGQMVDPTSFANEITDPAKPDTAGLVQPYVAPDMSQYAPSGFAAPPAQFTNNLPAYGGGGGAPMAAPAPTPAPSPYVAPKPAAGGTPWSGGGTQATATQAPGWANSLPKPVAQNINSSTNDPAFTSGGDSQYWDSAAQGWKNFDGSPIAMATGGATTAPQFIVGDKPQGLGDDSEMIMNPTGAPIRVLSHEQMMQMMDQARAQNAPRYAWGTSFDAGQTNWGQAPGQDLMAQSPMTPPAPATPQQGGGFSGYGGSQSRNGRRPRPSGGFANQPPPQGGMGSPGMAAPQVQPMAPPPMPAPAPPQGGGGVMTSPGMQENQAQPMAQPQAAAAAPALPTYGMPDQMAFTKYDPSVLGNQPFYQKLLGNLPNPSFQGFGGTLSNPSLGIVNAPSLLNYQNYLGMNPSEQQQTQGLYSQGLAMDWGDMLNRARASYAPMLAGRAGGIAQYGA